MRHDGEDGNRNSIHVNHADFSQGLRSENLILRLIDVFFSFWAFMTFISLRPERLAALRERKGSAHNFE
jgi:hypothetical protein